jgi:hypothetical protein
MQKSCEAAHLTLLLCGKRSRGPARAPARRLWGELDGIWVASADRRNSESAATRHGQMVAGVVAYTRSASTDRPGNRRTAAWW